MNYLKNFLFNVVLLISFVFSSQLTAAEREDLYQSGKSAYESQNYVTAIKNLYAFYVLNIDFFDKDPTFKDSIEKKIAECETILKLALALNKSIDMSEGKFILRTNEIHGGFKGTAHEIQELFKKDSVDLEMMMDSRKGAPLGKRP